MEPCQAALTGSGMTFALAFCLFKTGQKNQQALIHAGL